MQKKEKRTTLNREITLLTMLTSVGALVLFGAAMICLFFYFFLGNIMAISEDVKEAAMLDGASGFKQDWYITPPMIKETLRTVSILAGMEFKGKKLVNFILYCVFSKFFVEALSGGAVKG